MVLKHKRKQRLIEMINSLKNTKNKLALLLLNNKNYSKEMNNIIKKAQNKSNNICYVCFSKPYAEVIENLKNERINLDGVTFIDTLSSPKYPLKPINNCIFVQGMENLKLIKKALNKAVNKKGCKAVIFDSISTLLIYQQPFSIIKFTHELITDEKHKKASKVYIILKERGIYRAEIAKLIKDLNLFADKIFEI